MVGKLLIIQKEFSGFNETEWQSIIQFLVVYTNKFENTFKSFLIEARLKLLENIKDSKESIIEENE